MHWLQTNCLTLLFSAKFFYKKESLEQIGDELLLIRTVTNEPVDSVILTIVRTGS
jgi:hypothetical protein